MAFVWPFCPLDGYRERLEWLTEVMTARAGQQRIARRGAPRQQFEGRYALDAPQYSRARAFMAGQYDQEVLLPVWPELERAGSLSAGAGSIAMDDTAVADYRPGGQALVWESDALHEAVDLSAVGPTSLSLDGTLVNDYDAALVMPLRRAWIMDEPKGSREFAGYIEFAAEFEVIDNLDLAASIGLPTYRGLDVLTDIPKLSAGLSDSVKIVCEDVDNDVGPRARLEWQRWLEQTCMLSWDFTDRAGVWRLREFLHRVRGRQKSFWIPTWNADLAILSNIAPASTTVDVTPIGWPDHYDQVDILIRSTAGVDHYLRVDSATTVGAVERLALETAAGFTLAAADVALACFVLPMRLDADRIEIVHEAGGAAQCRVPATTVPLPA